MKLITNNIWGGRVYEPLIEFIKANAKTTDIFCFQEMYDTSSSQIHTRTIIKDPNNADMITNNHGARANIYTEISQVLPSFEGYFHPVQKDMDFHGKVEFDLQFGNALFVRKSVNVTSAGEFFVHRKKNSMVGIDWTTLGRNLEYIQFDYKEIQLTIANFHGIHGNGKVDTQERIAQAKKVKAFLDRQKGLKILCGDFNLLPDTQSMSIMEEGMVNLVKKYGVTSTRSQYYKRPMRLADYILVSPEITVNEFKVLQSPVSDHLPLFLDFT